jgi:hypothetical protein
MVRPGNPENIDSWSQMVIKHTEDTVDIVTAAPESGIWQMLPDGRIEYERFDYHRRAVEGEHEAFFLRILKAGEAYLFDSRIPHRFRNVSDKRTIVISACTPPYL